MVKRCTIILFSVILLHSCEKTSKDEVSAYKALTQTLTNVNKTLTNHNDFLLHSLNNKLTDPQTKDKASIWYPKAMYVQHLSSEILAFIDDLEHTFTQAPEIGETDTHSVTNLFYEKKMADTLKAKLFQFKTDLRSVDSEITSQFENDLNDSSEKADQEFLTSIFKNASVVKAISILVKLETDIVFLENKILTYCNNKVPEIDRSDFRI